MTASSNFGQVNSTGQMTDYFINNKTAATQQECVVIPYTSLTSNDFLWCRQSGDTVILVNISEHGQNLLTSLRCLNHQCCVELIKCSLCFYTSHYSRGNTVGGCPPPHFILLEEQIKSTATVDCVKHQQSEVEKIKEFTQKLHKDKALNIIMRKQGECNADFDIKVNLIRINQKIN